MQIQKEKENFYFPLLESLLEDYKEVQDGKYTKIIHPFVTYWYYDGKLHRENGPAIEWNDGTQIWFNHGRKHRLDGPANISSITGIRWYIEGIEYTKQEFYKYLENKKLREKLQSNLYTKNIVSQAKL